MTGETGSYRFMAPEVFRHENYDETVDVYSYGMILYYLVTTQPPWPTLSGMEAVKRASEGDRPIIPRNLDVRISTLIRDCWDANPKVRPPFSEINKILAEYGHDAFFLQDNAILRVDPPEVESDCCIIL